MNTILVPTDFSAAAKSAALYAISFAKQLSCTEIVLYNAYQVPLVTDTNMTLVDTIDIDDMKAGSESQLESFRSSLLEVAGSITLKTVSDYGLITTDINEVCEEYGADIIIMGVTGGGKIEEALIGSFAIDVSRKANLPVIIVPPGAEFSEIKEVMLACDFSKLGESIPVDEIKKLLDETRAKLFVVSIGQHQKQPAPGTDLQNLLPSALQQGYNPEYHFIEDADFVGAINKFALANEVDLIITIPKKMGWFDALFHKSHTKALAYHSHVPLMVVHE